MMAFKSSPQTDKAFSDSYSTGTEADPHQLSPLSWPGIVGGVGRISSSLVALQAALVYSLPAWMKSITELGNIRICNVRF